MDESEAARSLAYALEKYPERVEVVPAENLVIESARENDKRPAYVKLAVPDEIAKSLRGPSDKSRNLVLVVNVPKDVLERSESRIILPGE